MKSRKVIAVGLIYFFMFTLMPIGFLCEKVQALESFKKYDVKSTEIGNKYGVKGEVLKVKYYDECILVLTKDSIYFIEKDNVKKYDLGKIDILPETNIQKVGKYIYLNPYKQNSLYKLLTIDTESLNGESKLLDEYIKLDNYVKNPVLQEIVVDEKGNKWFSVCEKDKKTYKLLKLENSSENKISIIDTVEVNKDYYYDDMLTNLKVDSDENVWFKITENDGKTKKYMLGRISKDGKRETFDLSDNIIDYMIDKDGHIWVIQKDKFVHLSSSGILLREFKGDTFKEVIKDSKGDILVLDKNKFKKVEYGNLKEFSDVEEISVDSYVNNSAQVLKDDNSDIKILSNNGKKFIEVNLKDGKFNIVNKGEGDFGDNYKSVVYNGDLYILSGDSIYKFKNNSIENYIKLSVNTQMGDKLISVNVDKKGTLYAISEQKLFVIDKNKNVDEIELSKLYSYNSIIENKLIRDNKGDIYLITKTVGELKLNKLDGKEYRTINYRNKDGLEPINIFLNENDEFEFVYNDKEKPYKIYKLDENLLPQEDARFNNEGTSLMETYQKIQSLKKTADGKLILWIGKNMLYIKDKDRDNFRGLYDISSNDIINNMVQGNDGKVYVGTSNSGVICYGEKINIDPSNYNTKTPKNSELATENKKWTIKFNTILDKNTVNEDNVLVVNSNGEKQDVKIALNSDNSSIVITPEKVYKNGEEYYIIVREGLKSQKGKSLKKEVLAKFKVTKKAEVEENKEEVKFEIITPANLEIREKSFVEFIVEDWKKGNSFKVGKVTVEELNVSTDTAYISFTAEVYGENGKEVKKVSLNCKKVDGVWGII